MLKLQEPKSLKLGKYPYTYVRTIVMKSMLFRREEYHKMLKMGFSEIAKFLQDSHYKKEIDEFARQYSGADLLELALNRNLAESFKKLIRISPYELSLPIKEYIKRKDMEDIKTIIRGKFTNADEKQILGSITAAGELSYGFLSSLLKKPTIEEVLKHSKLADFGIFEDGLKDLKEKKTIMKIENTLDKSYYSHMIKFSRILPKEGALFRNFLLKEVEILNILTILRLKKNKLGKEAAKNFIILSNDKQKDSKIMKLAELSDLGELSAFLEKTEYKGAVSKGIREFGKNGSLIVLEAEMYKHLLKQSILLLHQHPLSIDIILGYMLAKDIEVRNLKIIVKGKQLGLKEELIESQLVF
ncbi:ATP synthase A1 subunit C [Candidatus Woesearchaeota archaeon]|nr:ATP synthase A1 subunit C [Candidatus Woesearchaeota archaeon]